MLFPEQFQNSNSRSRLLYFLFAIAILLTAVVLSFSTLVFPAGCVACSELKNAPQAQILSLVDEPSTTLESNLFYENVSDSPSRKPIANSIVIIELTNTTGPQGLYKAYTDEEGKIKFNFEEWSHGCINIKVLYCPFCDINSPACGFSECLAYSKIHSENGYYPNVNGEVQSASNIPDAPGSSPPASLNPIKYLPELDAVSYCAPPPPLSATPAVCLPLLIIFSLLAGALYATGRNPFMGFNLGGQKVGRHIRYQARGRGYYLNAMSVISAGATVASAAKTIATGEKGALLKSEKQNASGRVFMAGDLKRGMSGAKSAAKKSGKGGAGPKGSSQSSPTMTGTGMMFTPGGAGGGVKSSDLFTNKGGLYSTAGGIKGVASTAARLSLFVATQTILGRTIDYAYSTATGKSIFQVAFNNPQQKINEAQIAINGQVVKDKDGNITGVKVENEDGSVNIVKGVQRQADGTLVFILENPSGSARGQTADGQKQITISPEGKITSVSYQINLSLEFGGGSGIVKLTSEKGVLVANVTNSDGVVRVITDPGSTGNSKTITNWDSITSPYFSNSKMMVGSDATNFVENYRGTMEGIAELRNTIAANVGMQMRDLSDKLKSESESNSEFKKALLAEADRIASLELKIAGIDAIGTLSAKQPGALPPGKAAETAQKIADIHSETLGSKEFLDKVHDKGGQALVETIAKFTPAELANMNLYQLTTALQKEGLNPTDASKAASASFELIRDGGKEFLEKSGDIPQLANTRIGVIDKAAKAGEISRDPTAIITHDPQLLSKFQDQPSGFSTVSPEIRRDVREYIDQNNFSQAGGALDSALSSAIIAARPANQSISDAAKDYAEAHSIPEEGVPNLVLGAKASEGGNGVAVVFHSLETSDSAYSSLSDRLMTSSAAQAGVLPEGGKKYDGLTIEEQSNRGLDRAAESAKLRSDLGPKVLSEPELCKKAIEYMNGGDRGGAEIAVAQLYRTAQEVGDHNAMQNYSNALSLLQGTSRPRGPLSDADVIESYIQVGADSKISGQTHTEFVFKRITELDHGGINDRIDAKERLEGTFKGDKSPLSRRKSEE